MELKQKSGVRITITLLQGSSGKHHNPEFPKKKAQQKYFGWKYTMIEDNGY